MKAKQKWFPVALLAAVLMAPNAMLLRYALSTWDPFFLNFVRFGIGGMLLMPLVIKNFHTFSGKARKSVAIVVAVAAIVATTNALALNYGPASYFGLISLLSPLMLVWYATKLTHEHLTPRAVAGITLAAIGALFVVLLPIALSQNHDFVFYPLATLFAVISVITMPLATVELKIANQQHHVPLFPLLGLGNMIGAMVSFVLWHTVGDGVIPEFHTNTVLAVLYSGLISALLSRALLVMSYERVGAAVNSVLGYVSTFLAILLPVLFLNEKLSVEMVVGGMLILLGVFVVEHHKSTHHKHHHFLSGQ